MMHRILLLLKHQINSRKPISATYFDATRRLRAAVLHFYPVKQVSRIRFLPYKTKALVKPLRPVIVHGRF